MWIYLLYYLLHLPLPRFTLDSFWIITGCFVYMSINTFFYKILKFNCSA
ncbi:hypothetical protein BAZSYMB_GCONTIG00784_0 [Bathymodiolus azoricus thioautotrophic gill symbiont]|uniref:Uncharacterized protein n=1 Tax=Bathymodiolus azoricus thioautotrophic gill symbiont TaxID=235205 RepID=A0A1H6LSR4_9GAMM|nr:hypothetical protein BAZSYMB_GCONTIG00784_0 [Bathymodiolus azoricus thioautotrophic gill symbiont]